MTSYCKGCAFHHNAGHKNKPAMARYNDWCCRFGRTAKKATGECKLKSGRKEKV